MAGLECVRLRGGGGGGGGVVTPVILTLKLSTINTRLFNLHKTATTGTLQQKGNREKKCDVTLPW